MKRFDIKVGSVLLWKKYNLFKRIWAWLTNKKLPYNRATLWNTAEEGVLVYGGTNHKLYDLVKPYNNKELKKLENFATTTTISEFISDSEDSIELIINCIRPNTISADSNAVDGDYLAGNKYYRLHNEKAK